MAQSVWYAIRHERHVRGRQRQRGTGCNLGGQAENFRIDQVSSNFYLKFRLENDTLVRFEGLQHK